MKFAAAVLGAVFLSQASAAEWVIAPPMEGADKAPTFVVIPGVDPEAWPLDYPLAKVGQSCGAEASPSRPEWRLVLGRKGVATRCEVKK